MCTVMVATLATKQLTRTLLGHGMSVRELRSNDLVSSTMFPSTPNMIARAFLTAVAKFHILDRVCAIDALGLVLASPSRSDMCQCVCARGKPKQFPRVLLEMSTCHNSLTQQFIESILLKAALFMRVRQVFRLSLTTSLIFRYSIDLVVRLLVLYPVHPSFVIVWFPCQSKPIGIETQFLFSVVSDGRRKEGNHRKSDPISVAFRRPANLR